MRSDPVSCLQKLEEQRRYSTVFIGSLIGCEFIVNLAVVE